MGSKEISNGLLRTIFILSGICISLYLFYKLSTVVVYCLMAVLMTLITSPMVEFFKKKLKIKNTLAVVITLFIIIILIIFIVLLFVPLIISQGENLSLLDMNSLEKNYNEILFNVNSYLSKHHINLSQVLNPAEIASKFDFNFIPNIFNGILNAISGFGMALASVLFISFFLLKDKEKAVKTFKYVLPKNQKAKILVSLEKIQHLLSRYFIGLLTQLLIILILDLIVFLIFGVQNAFIIALLCAILNIIPYLGPLLGMIVASILIMISGIGHDFISETLPTLFYVLIGMFIVQLIDNNLSQPIIFSKSTKSHPLEIFLIIIAAGLLFGITGMIVAVPSYTSLKVIGKEFLPNNRIVKALTKNI